MTGVGREAATSQGAHRAAQRRFDAAERRVVRDIDLLYRETFDLFRVEVEIVEARVQMARATGELIDEAWLSREPAYRRLIDRAASVLRGFRDRAMSAVLMGALRFSVLARSDVVAQLMALGIASSPEVALPVTPPAPTSGLTGIVRVVPNTGQASDELLASLERIRAQLIANLERDIAAIATVDGQRLTVASLRDQVYDRATEARLRTIIRTTTMQAYRDETMRRYEAAGAVIERVQWVATLSPRTCLACLSRHGMTYPVGYRMESHPNCRCRLVPVVTGMSDDVPVTGEAWFDRQPAEVQRARMGVAYPAYASGRLTLADFAGVRQSERHGRSVYQRSAREVLRRAG